MIPVRPQPAPSDFDVNVRQPGLDWLRQEGLDPAQPAPKKTKWKACWTKSNEQLWEAYSRTCAYLGIYFQYPTGAATTDHFIPKSQCPGLAFEWSNFRLSCLGPNRKKNNSNMVLDPFLIQPDTFRINFASGEISPNPALPDDLKKMAKQTIKQLGLDKSNEMRARHYEKYAKREWPLSFLREQSPFVHAEIVRQGL